MKATGNANSQITNEGGEGGLRRRGPNLVQDKGGGQRAEPLLKEESMEKTICGTEEKLLISRLPLYLISDSQSNPYPT